MSFDAPPHIAVCERDRFAQSRSAADLICTDDAGDDGSVHWLSGYRCYAVEEWLLDWSQPFWVVVERSTRDDDRIAVATFAQSVDSTASQVSAWHDIFVAASNTEGIVPRDTPHGVLLTTTARHLVQFGLHLIELPGGDYEQHKHELFYRLTLKRLSCCAPSAPLTLLPSDGRLLEETFCAHYRVVAADGSIVTADSATVRQWVDVAMRRHVDESTYDGIGRY